MTPERRKEWEATRSKGQIRFLLLPGLPFGLGAALAAITRWGWESGFSSSTLRDSNFWVEVGLTFFTVYTILCFGQMVRWRSNEEKYSSGLNDKRREFEE